MYQYKCDIIRLIDGDTVEVRLDMGLHVFKVEKIRLRGIDAPERGKPGGTEATAWLKEKLAGHDIYIETVKQDKYGRFLGWFYHSKDEMRNQGFAGSINLEMVKSKHARLYSGGKRKY